VTTKVQLAKQFLQNRNMPSRYLRRLSPKTGKWGKIKNQRIMVRRYFGNIIRIIKCSKYLHLRHPRL